MVNVLYLLVISLLGQVASVDEAIDLYLMGDMNSSIAALENLLQGQELSLDDEIRVYHRLGAAYFGIGEPDRTESAFYSLLLLDPYYDLGPWENPQLRRILDEVRNESMATVLIQGEPQGALVFMNGRYVGSAPYIQDNLIGGNTYTFTIMADGYRADVQTCSTSPGQLHTMIYKMEPIAPASDLAMSDTLSRQDGHQATEIPEGSGDGQGTGGSGPPQQDTSNPSVSDASESMTIEQLNDILHGGEQMTALANTGLINIAEEEHSAAGSPQSESRDHDMFQSSGGTIETEYESQARMVFSDVNIENENVLQTDPGSTYSSRTSSEVREVLASKESAVTFIYNKHLRSDPLLAGTVVIEMVIEPSGRVSNVSILDSNTMNPAFDLELASTVETWRFGAVDEDEGPLPVTYPFSFSR